jgi:hypothetical protein
MAKPEENEWLSGLSKLAGSVAGAVAGGVAGALNKPPGADKAVKVKPDPDLKVNILKGQSQFDSQVVPVYHAIDLFFKAYRQGMVDFGAALTEGHIEKGEEESNELLGLSLKVLSVAFAISFPEEVVAEKLGEMAARGIKEITVAALDVAKEQAAKSKAEGRGNYLDFMKSLGDASIHNEGEMTKSITTGTKTLKDAYEFLSNAEGTTTNSAAALLNASQASSAAMVAGLTKWHDPNKFEQYFATKFALEKPGGEGKPKSEMGRDEGVLWFGLDIEYTYHQDGRKPDIKKKISTDTKWKLVMENKGDARGDAIALMQSFNNSVWQIKLPKRVFLRVYEGGMNMTSGILRFAKGNDSGKIDGMEDIKGGLGHASEDEAKQVLRSAWEDFGKSIAMKDGLELAGDSA